MSNGRNGVENGGCGSISWNLSSLSRRKISRAGARIGGDEEENTILRHVVGRG